ncbi:hypothetical protein ALC57_11626 [Trachymyrmex cornetzi]|uniref:Uncharacterized protein n=1 Tax=Trachymyrmex cornetzi TaxID=471704 RepID=A0A195DTC8_9HYME|nr:hypothetical protein ALC57_11626 [Trachymyrmex cornetzi]
MTINARKKRNFVRGKLCPIETKMQFVLRISSLNCGFVRQLVGNFVSTSTRKWRTLVARYARDNCVLTLMITWNYVCAALYVHWARLRSTAAANWIGYGVPLIDCDSRKNMFKKPHCMQHYKD